jgi:hypothetical protein
MAVLGSNPEMETTNWLLVLSPAVTMTPSRPPLSTPSRFSRLTPPLCRLPAWQRKQEALKRGKMSLVYVRPVLSEDGGSLVTSMAAAAENDRLPTRPARTIPEIFEMFLIRKNY